jgi:hypothetical protein
MAWHSGPISHIRERAEGDHQAVLCHCPFFALDLEVLGCEPLGQTLIVGVTFRRLNPHGDIQLKGGAYQILVFPRLPVGSRAWWIDAHELPGEPRT